MTQTIKFNISLETDLQLWCCRHGAEEMQPDSEVEIKKKPAFVGAGTY